MDNQQLINRATKVLESEDEPSQSDWIDMVQSLCTALIEADTHINLLTTERDLALYESGQ